jgi:hypothetical protein
MLPLSPDGEPQRLTATTYTPQILGELLVTLETQLQETDRGEEP